MRAIFLMAVLACGIANAENKDPRPDMHVMAAEITSLQKFLLTDSDFAAPANEPAIKKSLGTLETHLAHLDKGAFADDPSLRVNLSMIQQQIKDVRRTFDSGEKSFARYMLQSSFQMCIACHTRKKAADFSWPDADAKDMAPIDKADYLFATRQFKKGVAVYESIAEGYPGNHVGQPNLRKALLALAVYYARVSEDPAGGAKYFAKVAKNEEFPVYLKEEMGAWAKEFSDWAKEKSGKGTDKLTETQLLAKAKKILRHDDFSLISEIGRSFHVRRLRASSLLQRVLEAPGAKSPNKGEALLYLGQIYSKISTSIFFRFGEMYLKACISEYPKTQAARSCYVALEIAVTDGFSGSAGTNVPEDEQVELMRLKRLAF